MLAASCTFGVMAGMIKQVSLAIHPFEIVFFRNLFGLVPLLPWFWHAGWAGLKTARPGLIALRSLCGCGAMLCFFYAIATIPLTDATALSFTAPIFATVLAVLVLGERIRARRIVAVACGLIGAAVMLRPGFETVALGALAAVAAAVFRAVAMTCVKLLTATEPPNRLIAWTAIVITPVSLLFALPFWVWPSWTQLAWLLAIGVVATAAHQFLVRAFRAAEATAVQPFDYARLVFAGAIGYVAFDQTIDRWTLLGSAIIVGSGLYMARREAQLARAGQTVAPKRGGFDA